jgi:hypothetical protein
MIAESGTRLEAIATVNHTAAVADDVEVTVSMIGNENHANLVVEIEMVGMVRGDLIGQEMNYVGLHAAMSYHLDEEWRFGMVMDRGPLHRHHRHLIRHHQMEILEAVGVEIERMIGIDAMELLEDQGAIGSADVVEEMIMGLTASGGGRNFSTFFILPCCL